MTRDAPILRAYKYALDPTPEQESMLRSHCGAQRFAYNWALGVVRANISQRAAEQSYGLVDGDLTPKLDWSGYGLRKKFNLVKNEIAPWWSENSKEAYASGIANLAAALSNWTRSRAGNQHGPRVGFPRFKSKKSAHACRFTTGAIGLSDGDRRHVRLPRIGSVRTHESTRKLARRLDAGTARIRSATVSYSRGRWFVAFSAEVDPPELLHRSDVKVVGVDLGLNNLAVLSVPVAGLSDTEGMIANPRRYEFALRKLRKLHRQAARRRGPDKRTGAVPSRRWERTRVQIAKVHSEVANGRVDGLHKLSTALSTRFGVIVMEDLFVAGMIRNHCLARRISGVGWGELRRQVAYKTTWAGSQLLTADRFYPSSKTCSQCGVVKDKLRLSERQYRCEACGLTVDRDINAARNLAQLATVMCSASTPSCGATTNEPAGNPSKTGGRAGTGYRHGKPLEGNVTQQWAATTQLVSASE